MRYSYSNDVVFDFPENKYMLTEQEGFFNSTDIVIIPTQFNKENNLKLAFKLETEWWDESDGDVIEAEAKDNFSYAYFSEILNTQPRSLLKLEPSIVDFYLDLSHGQELKIKMMFVPDTHYSEVIGILLEILSGTVVRGRKVDCRSITAAKLIEKATKATEEHERKAHEETEKKRKKALENGMKATKAHTAKYNDLFTFDLSDGYDLVWDEQDDGTKAGKIITGICLYEDGERNYDTAFPLDDLSRNMGPGAGGDSIGDIESLLQKYQGCRHRVICDDPKTVVVVNDSVVSFLGTDLKLVNADLLVNYASSKILLVHYADSLVKVKKDKAAFLQNITDVARMIRFRGKPLSLRNIDLAQMAREMIRDEFEAEATGAVGMKVVVNDKDVLGNETAKAMDDVLKRLAEKYAPGKPRLTSFAALQRENSDINWNGLTNYIKKRYNLTPAAYFKAEQIIQTGKKEEIPLGSTETKKDPQKKTTSTAATAKKEPAKGKTTSSPAKTSTKNAAPVPVQEMKQSIPVRYTDAGAGDEAENGARFDLLQDKGPVIGQEKYKSKISEKYLQIPEGVSEIQGIAFFDAKCEIVKFPRSLRKIGPGAFASCPNLKKVIFQEGLEVLDDFVFSKCDKLSELHLPNSIAHVQEFAFADSAEMPSRYTVYLSGKAARKLYENRDFGIDGVTHAKCFVIDGCRYTSITEYLFQPRPADVQRQAQEPMMSNLQQDQDPQSSIESSLNSIEKSLTEMQITILQAQLQQTTGIAGIFKRRKIQKEIKELEEKLKKL